MFSLFAFSPFAEAVQNRSSITRDDGHVNSGVERRSSECTSKNAPQERGTRPLAVHISASAMMIMTSDIPWTCWLVGFAGMAVHLSVVCLSIPNWQLAASGLLA
jgi:hypothetical protein